MAVSYSDAFKRQLKRLRRRYRRIRHDLQPIIEQLAAGETPGDPIQGLGWSVQTKLLRLLEHHEFVPLGGSAPMPADLRVIAGTRRRLEALVTRGTFRADLYFRLRALTVSLPPLHATAHRDPADP